jgi:GH24 family phage-related lysozyme (muramidase)
VEPAALAAQLKIDEGSRLTAYIDRAGGLTVGVGHLVRGQDHLRRGQRVTAAHVEALLAADIRTALALCQRLWPAFDTFPEEAQQVLANLAFNLGPRLGRFPALRAAVARHDWRAAAQAMRRSRWAHQVGPRASRLVERMRALATPEDRRAD